MAEWLNFGNYQLNTTLGAIPILIAAYFLMQAGGIQLAEYKILGVLLLFGVLLIIFAVNSFIALFVYNIGQRNQMEKEKLEMEKSKMEVENQVKLAESEREDKNEEARRERERVQLEADIAEKKTRLTLEQRKQESELKVNEKKELTAIESSSVREKLEAEIEYKKREYEAIGDHFLKRATSGPFTSSGQNNL